MQADNLAWTSEPSTPVHTANGPQVHGVVSTMMSHWLHALHRFRHKSPAGKGYSDQITKYMC